MLHRYCSQFLAYCQLADFSACSFQALNIRLNEFKAFLFLTLHRIIPENIATGIPYPKIDKTVPEFLTQ